MTIAAEIQSLSPSAIIELFTLDTTSIPGGTLMHFHAGTNRLMQPVTWQGVQYVPMPIEAEGFDLSSRGVLPRPKIRVANVNGLLSAEVRNNDDLVGCKVIRKRTFAKFLDASNFIDGINIFADPNQSLPDDVWFVESKTSENRYLIEWELSSAFDLQGVRLPHREVIQNCCVWKYRSAECGYSGSAYFDANDQVTNQAGDFCSKRLSSCKIRFGSGNTLPYGGFPGAVRYE